MKMKEHIRYYLIYGLIFFFGASCAAGLYFAYHAELLRPLYAYTVPSLSFADYVRLTATLLRPLVLSFLSGFTIYACAVSALSLAYTGFLCGQMLMAYCLSPFNPFTHAAVLIFLLGLGALSTVFSTKTAIYRNTLKAIAPDPVPLMKAAHTKAYFTLFLSASLILISVSAAVYLLSVYFPL